MPPPVTCRRFPPGGPRWRVHGSRRWPRWSSSCCSARRSLRLPAPCARRRSTAQAAVAWPPSSGLLVAEVVTGGASASDEYVELTNASAAAVDLAGLEVAYVTSSGSTVTRKASWSSPLALEPGRHLLVANASGIYAASADATYSGGFAATGGAIVVRPIGGQPIDAVGWGDATNALRRGDRRTGSGGGQLDRAAAGRSAGQLHRHERQRRRLHRQRGAVRPEPGGRARSSGSAQRVAVPESHPHADADTDADADADTGTDSDTRTDADAEPDVRLRPQRRPRRLRRLRRRRRPRPRPRRPSPTPTPTDASDPDTRPDADRLLRLRHPRRPSSPPRSRPCAPWPTARPRRIEGVLTTDLGALESARSGFVQDATDGIAIYLDAPFDAPVTAGSRIRAHRQRRQPVRPADAPGRPRGRHRARRAVAPDAARRADGRRRRAARGPAAPGRRDRDRGADVAERRTRPDGRRRLRRGAGDRRAGRTGWRRPGSRVRSWSRAARSASATAPGPASTGTASTRRSPASSRSLPPPTPSPTATPDAVAVPVADRRTLADRPTAQHRRRLPPRRLARRRRRRPPRPRPPAPSLRSRSRRLGSAPSATTVLVRGVVIAEAGTARHAAPARRSPMHTGGIPVKLPDGVAPPSRGALLEVRGLARRSVRPGSSCARQAAGSPSSGRGRRPRPSPCAPAPSASRTRVASLASAAPSTARRPSRPATTSRSRSPGRTGRRCGSSPTHRRASKPACSARAAGVSLTGIVGQRASRKGAFDGYRLWLRDRGDVVITAQPAPTPSPRGGSTPTPGNGAPKPSVMSVRAALLHTGQRVTVEGTLTVGTSLLDASGRRTIVEDGTAAIEVYLPAPDAAMRLGTRVRVTGTVGEAWGAPRLRADETRVQGSRQPRSPRPEIRRRRPRSNGGWSGWPARSSRSTGAAIDGRPSSRSTAGASRSAASRAAGSHRPTSPSGGRRRSSASSSAPIPRRPTGGSPSCLAGVLTSCSARPCRRPAPRARPAPGPPRAPTARADHRHPVVRWPRVGLSRLRRRTSTSATSVRTRANASGSAASWRRSRPTVSGSTTGRRRR